MILDASGRPIRRAIGFRLEFVYVVDPENVPADAVGCERIDLDDDDSETLDEPTPDVAGATASAR